MMILSEKLLRTVALSILATGTLMSPLAVYADEALREAGRKVVQQYSDAVISVEVVAEAQFSYGGQQSERETKQEVNGLVISPEGLVLVPLSEVDPTSLAERMNPGEEAGFKITVKGIRYIMADGTEIPAKLVLRDNERDLGFLQPETPVAKPLTFVDLGVESTTPEIMEPVMVVARSERVAGRTPLGMSGEIQGVITKPQPFYVPSSELASSGTGVPVFNSKGEVIGVILLRVLPGGNNLSNDSESPYLYVVVPNLEIADAADQLKPAETKPAE